MNNLLMYHATDIWNYKRKPYCKPKSVGKSISVIRGIA